MVDLYVVEKMHKKALKTGIVVDCVSLRSGCAPRYKRATSYGGLFLILLRIFQCRRRALSTVRLFVPKRACSQGPWSLLPIRHIQTFCVRNLDCMEQLHHQLLLGGPESLTV
jgi:hypothetical protein